MSDPTPHAGTAPQQDAGWDAITAQLLAARARVFKELREYPTPIAGCDVQFNRLLEQRDAIAAELAGWQALRNRAAQGGLQTGAVQAFVRGSTFLDEALSDTWPSGT